MSDELIDHYVDRPAVAQDTAFLKGELAEVVALFDKLKATKIDLQGATKIREVADATKRASEETVQLQQSVKAVTTLVNQRYAAEARLETLQTKLAQETANYRTEIQKTNKELKAQAEIAASATGSLDNINARLKKLRSEKGGIAPVTKEDIALIEQYKKRIDNLEEQRKKLLDKRQAQANNVGNYNASAQVVVDALEKEIKKLGELEKARTRVQNAGSSFTPGTLSTNRATVVAGFAGAGTADPTLGKIAAQATTADKAVELLNEEIERSRTVVEGFKRVTDQPLFLKAAGGLADANKELAFFRKALIDLERQGLGNSDAANGLRKQLAELQDQISDTKEEIKALSSDTRSFDLFASGVSFVADSFQLAASSAALFGASEEDVQEATKNLVAIQGISNGLKGVANELTTKGTAANVVYAAVQKVVATATDSTASATARLAAAGKLLLGIGIIAAIGYLVAKMLKLGEAISDAARQQKLLADVNKEFAQSAGQSVAQLDVLYRAATNANIPIKERKKAVDEIQEQYPEYFKNIKDEIILQGKAGEAYGRTKLAILEVAKTRAIENKLAELATKDLELQFEKQNLLEKQRANQAKQRAADAQRGDGLDQFNAISEGSSLKKDIADTNKELEALGKDRAFLLDQITNAGVGTKQGGGAAKSGAKSEAVKAISTQFEQLKLERQRYIDFLKDKAGEEIDLEGTTTAEKKLFYAERLQFLRMALKEEEQLSKDAEAEKIRLATEAANREKKGKGKADRATIEANLQQEIKLIEAAALDERLRQYREYVKRYGDISKALGDDLDEEEKKRLETRQKRLEELAERGLRKRTSPDTEKDIEDLNDAEKRFAEKKEQLTDTLKQLRSSLISIFSDTISDLGGSFFDKQIQDLDLLIRKNNELKDAQINRINQEVISNEEKAAKIAILEAQTDAKNEAIERRKAELEARKAKFEKAIAIGKIIVDTIVGVNKVKAEAAALAANPVTAVLAPLALAQIPFLLLSQGLALATVAARPIPKFFKGLFHDYKGPGIMDDGGKKEALVRADGSIEIAPGPAQERVVNINPGDRILPDASVLYDAMRWADYQATMRAAGVQLPNVNPLDTTALESRIEQQTKRLENAIRNQPRNITKATDRGMVNIWQWGANETKFLDDNTNWK